MKRLLSILIIIGVIMSMASCIFGNTFLPDSLINGVNLGEYKIVYDAESNGYNLNAAKYIQTAIEAKTGCTLPVIEDGEAESEHEIVVGETSRPISKELTAKTEGFEFAILAKGGSVALEADYFVISAAAYFFVDTYVKGPGENVDIPTTVSIHEPITKAAKNYILLIGDGMGVMQTQMFDYLEDTTDFSDGEDLFYGYMFPYQGFARTSSYSGVTDSAAAGTALATGYKTYNKYVGIDKDGNERQSLTELAISLGKATAVMSTEVSTGATPATFSAHTNHRDNDNDIRGCQGILSAAHGTIIDCGFTNTYSERYVKIIREHIDSNLSLLNDDDGFFLMYEEAYIDKNASKGELEKTYQTLLRFNQAIACFMEYAFLNPDTAVIITADHETGGLYLDDNGNLAFTSDDHTASDVPVFAWGEGLEALDGKTVENIEIAKLIASLMGEDNFGDPTNEWYDEIYGKHEENDEPTAPSEPSDPTDSDEPGDPADPVDPDEPSDPVDPEDPTEPSNPSEPTEPEITNPPRYQIGDKISSHEFKIYDENGNLTKVYDPSENSGKVTVINFWGTWCYYCLLEMPHFNTVATELADIVEIVALHTSDDGSEHFNYAEQNFPDSAIHFGPDHYGPDGEEGDFYYYLAFGGEGYFPYTVFIDPNGVVFYAHTGAMDYDTLYTYIMAAYANAN